MGSSVWLSMLFKVVFVYPPKSPCGYVLDFRKHWPTFLLSIRVDIWRHCSVFVCWCSCAREHSNFMSLSPAPFTIHESIVWWSQFEGCRGPVENYRVLGNVLCSWVACGIIKLNSTLLKGMEIESWGTIVISDPGGVTVLEEIVGTVEP